MLLWATTVAIDPVLTETRNGDLYTGSMTIFFRKLRNVRTLELESSVIKFSLFLESFHS